MESHQSKYRYERKYKLETYQYDSFVKQLYKEGFEKHYPSRNVNNIYLDNFSNDSYTENVEGESKRSKYRLRWYGNRFDIISPTFEVKSKKDTVNKKDSFKIPEFSFSSLSEINELINMHLFNSIKENHIKLYLKIINKTPVLLNGYQRDYFITGNKKIRLTIDRTLYYHNCINNQSYLDNNSMIIEIKYTSDTVPKINFDALGLTLAKNSKYVSGIKNTSFKL